MTDDGWRTRLAEMLAEHERRRRRKGADRAALKVARDYGKQIRHHERLRRTPRR